MGGFLQHIEDNEKLFDDHTLCLFLAHFDITMLKSSDSDNLIENEDYCRVYRTYYLQKLQEIKEGFNHLKTKDFNLNVKIDKKKFESDKPSISPEKTISLKLESIHFDKITINNKKIIIGNEEHPQHFPSMEILDVLNEGFEYEETYDLSDDEIQKIEKSVSISLNIDSLANITPVFNQPKLLMV